MTKASVAKVPKCSLAGRVLEPEEALDTALAIVDCAKVLNALYAAEAKPQEGTLATGAGFANGYALSAVTLAVVLAHAQDLIIYYRESRDAERSSNVTPLRGGANA